MATRTLAKEIKRRLYSFAHRLASPFSDARRRGFVRDMLGGLVIGGHVHLTRIARAIGDGTDNVHSVEKRLSKHLGSHHWDMSPLGDQLLAQAAGLVTDDTLIVADLTDIAKYYARKLEGLGRVHDGSDPEKRTAPGYVLFEAYVRVRRWQLFPLVLEPLKTYSGAPTSENAEIIAHVLRVHQATGGKGTWVVDRGFDRRNLFAPLVGARVAFVARLQGDRHVRSGDGRTLAVTALAEELKPATWPRRWPRGGYAVSQPIHLPEVRDQEFLLVVCWRWPGSQPLLLLVSPAARRPGRTARWFAQAYRRRWGVEDATWGIKQRFCLEAFLVRSWRSIRRLLWLVAWAFYWLNLGGEDRFEQLREALVEHPWRLPKAVKYVFDWIAWQIHELLHPRPRWRLPPDG
jgi:hypothetical protein